MNKTSTNIVLTLILKLFAAKKIFKGTFFLLYIDIIYERA